MSRSDERFAIPEATLEGAERSEHPAAGRRVAGGEDRWEGVAFALAIGVLLVVDFVIVVVLMRTHPQLPLLLPLVVLLPFLLVWIILRLMWAPWRRRYPAREIRPGAAQRSVQSARLGRLGGFNNCLVIASDDEHVHLWFMKPFGWLAPGRVSLPRRALAELRRHRFFGEYLAGRLDGVPVTLPAWCVDPGGANLAGDPPDVTRD